MTKKLASSKSPPQILQGMIFQDLSISPFKFDGKIEGYRFPAVIDMHLHGAFGWDFSFGDPDRIEEMLDKLMSEGLTGVLATLITCSEEQREKALKDLVIVAKRRICPPRILGIHLEGPFISPLRRGSHQEKFLLEPSFSSLQKWQQLAEGMIKMVTIAPELPEALKLISRAKKTGIIPSIGHSNADHDTTLEAIALGANHVTHFFNAMRNFKHREPSVVSAILSHPQGTIELIGDSIHVSPEIIEMMFSIFPKEHIVLVSDCVCPAGLQDGIFDAYGTHIEFSKGKCTFEGGNLFGGGKLLLQCISSLKTKTKIPVEVLSNSVSIVPSAVLGIDLPSHDVIVDTEFKWITTRFDDFWYWLE
ncbi:amidohydrolase family protein [bacterium]|nr:amidohydrolase family protein [bacterium]